MIDLQHSWTRAWRGVDATNDATDLCRELLARWSEAHRHYHTLQHLHECLALFDGVQALPEHPHEVEVALWFHDAIYDTRASDNELRSAHWAKQALADAGVPADVCERVHALVMATCHEAVPTGIDAQVLVDIDLAILGSGPERFAEYEAQVRAEYAHVPGFLFRRKRRAILRSFLQRERIYSTEHFRARFERRARENLAPCSD